VEDARPNIPKANSKLKDALAMNAEVLPGPVTHSSYYATLHAAITLLIAERGSAPHKHANVIAQFGMLVKDGDTEARDLGRAVNGAFDLRGVDDYDVQSDVSPEEASEARSAAQRFVDYCAKRVGAER